MDGMNKEKWQKMTPKQKREHVWEYYKLPIIGILIVLAVAGWFIHYELTYVEPQMQIIMTDMSVPLSDDSVYHDFLTEYGYEAYDRAIALNQNMYFSLDSEDPTMFENNGRSYELLFAMMATQTQDVLFTQPTVYGSCAAEGAMMDLSKVIPQEVLDAFSDHLFFVRDEETGEEYPCGVNVSGNPWMEKVQKDYKGYVGIINTTDDPQKAADFITYFLLQFGMVDGK